MRMTATPRARAAECAHGALHIGGLAPAVAGNRDPGRPSYCQNGNRSARRGACGVGRNARSIGMSRIDQCIDSLAREIINETLHAAETADPHRHSLCGRRAGTARKRERDRKVSAWREALCKAPRLRRSAENKDAPHVGG